MNLGCHRGPSASWLQSLRHSELLIMSLRFVLFAPKAQGASHNRLAKPRPSMRTFEWRI